MFLVHPARRHRTCLTFFCLNTGQLHPYSPTQMGPETLSCLALQAEATQRAEEGGAFWFSSSFGKANHTDLFLSANFRQFWCPQCYGWHTLEKAEGKKTEGMQSSVTKPSRWLPKRHLKIKLCTIRLLTGVEQWWQPRGIKLCLCAPSLPPVPAPPSQALFCKP